MRLYEREDMEGMILDPEPIELSKLQRSARYKRLCRRYATGETADGQLEVRAAKNSIDFDKIVETFERLCAALDCGLEVDSDLAYRFTRMRELAEEHYRLGNEVKRHDEKHAERFKEFSRVVDAAMVRPLKERQMWDAFFMASMQRAGNFSVPGSGKTATVLGAFAFLRARGRVNRLLVICPKNAFDSWRTEWRACFGEKLPLSCFSSQDASFLKLSKDDKKRYIRSSVGSADLLIVNYEATPGIAEELAGVASRDTLLVYDEVHRVKRVGGKWAAACLTIAQGAPATFALTGTPLPNTYKDLYNFLHILYPREYDSFFGYETSELERPDADEQAQINARLQPFYCRTTKDDLGVPPAEEPELVRVPADGASNSLLNMLIARYGKDPFTLLIRVYQLESDPAALLESVDPIDYKWLLDEDDRLGEADVVDYSDTIVAAIQAAAEQPTPKRMACLELVDSLVEEGRPVIVWCVLKRSLRALRHDLAARGIEARIIDGDVAQEMREGILNDFRGGRFPVLLTNPHTLAESVSLHMVCHDAVYFEYSFNLVHLLQSRDRIHRLGLAPDAETRYYFLMQDFDHKGGVYSMDERVYTRLCEKEDTMMRAIESGLIETEPTTEEDLAAIFEGLL